jgi:hypothetical protein
MVYELFLYAAVFTTFIVIYKVANWFLKIKQEERERKEEADAKREARNYYAARYTSNNTESIADVASDVMVYSSLSNTSKAPSLEGGGGLFDGGGASSDFELPSIDISLPDLSDIDFD